MRRPPALWKKHCWPIQVPSPRTASCVGRGPIFDCSANSAFIRASRSAASAGSAMQMTFPSSTEKLMYHFACSRRSFDHSSRRFMPDSPWRTRSRRQTRLTTSRRPAHIPSPAKGGMRWAASPTMRARPARQFSRYFASNRVTAARSRSALSGEMPHGSSKRHTLSSEPKSFGFSCGSIIHSQRRRPGPPGTTVVGRSGSHTWKWAVMYLGLSLIHI